MLFRSLQNAALSFHQRLEQRLFAIVLPYRYQLNAIAPGMVGSSSLVDLLQDSIWFAVPKKKVTRHKKRLKTTVQKRIPLRKDIVTDPRTGEVTLSHRLPSNWKDYLPKID
jgi:ribosomal protein L32